MSDWVVERFAVIIADAIKYFADRNVEIAKANNEAAIKMTRIANGRE